MNKIEREMVSAVALRHNWKKSNTRVYWHVGMLYVSLFGNEICKVSPNGVRYYSTAGWNTPTTLSRLRALGLPVNKRRGALYVAGTVWDGSWMSYN